MENTWWRPQGVAVPGSGYERTFSLPYIQVYEILARTPYGVTKRGEVGIDRLVNEKIFSAAYPLHEVRSSPQLIRLHH